MKLFFLLVVIFLCRLSNSFTFNCIHSNGILPRLVLLKSRESTFSLSTIRLNAKTAVINADVSKVNEVTISMDVFEGAAKWIERSVDSLHRIFNLIGVENSYGLSIIVFTFLSRLATLPLLIQQVEDGTKTEKLKPLQEKIKQKYAHDLETKNLLLAQLQQSAKISPYARLISVLFELPLAIAFQRAMQSLAKHQKLSEPFLWIPNLQGPKALSSDGKMIDSSSWLSNIFLGNANLGWSRTIAYMSLPFLYMMTRWISTKLISIVTGEESNQQSKQTTDTFSKKMDALVSLFMALSYLQLPSGIILYYIFNNIFSTALTLVVRENVKDRNLPLEVTQLMEFVDELVVDPSNSSLLLKATTEGQNVIKKSEKVLVSA